MIFIERKMFNSEVGVFFLVLKLPMTRRFFKSAESLVSCIINVSSITAVQEPEVEDSIRATGHKFHVFLDTR